MPYKKTDHYDLAALSKMIPGYTDMLMHVGEDPNREGLLKTPERASKAMQYLTQGYDQDAEAILRGAMFHEDYSEMVIVKDIELYSLCEHHMLPFYGKAHVAYIPNGRIVGLQERLTLQIRDAIQNTLEPLGVAVVIEASHFCMMMRGVQKQNSSTTTSAFTGQFEKAETRTEFLKLLSSKLH
jgi:GTP cyclohydrolase IA